MFKALENSYFFWYCGVPVTSAIIAFLYKLLSKQSDEQIMPLDFLIGIDLIISAFASNLAFAASRASQIPSQATIGFLIVTICLLIVLGLNAVFLRFSPWHSSWKTALSNIIGMATLSFSFIVWIG